MEVLKDYPKEFFMLFQPSFNCFSKVNVKIFSINEGFVKKYWRFFYIIPIVAINYATIGFKVVKLITEGQVSKLVTLLPTFLIITQALFKTIVLIPKKSLLSSIIKDLGSLWRTSELIEAQSKLQNKLSKTVTLCNEVTYWIGSFGAVPYLMSSLVETLVRKYIMKQDSELLLPVDSSYPFNPTENWLVYLAVYAFQTYSVFLFYSVYIGAELLMISVCANLGIEFILLCEDLSNVTHTSRNRPEVNEEFDTKQNDNEHRMTIGEVVQRHQKLCILSKRIDKAFNQMIFIDLLFVGIMACFFRTAAQYSRGPTYTAINYLAMICSLLHVLYLCYYGELLTGASLRVGDVAYNNLWYKCDTQYQKAICIIITRSQKACCMTSVNYAPITLSLFTKVISTTWSYLSLMNTVYSVET